MLAACSSYQGDTSGPNPSCDHHAQKGGSLSGKQTLPEKVAEAKVIIREAIAQFGLEQLAISFNGGKDSVVMLALVRDVLQSLQLPWPKLIFQFAEPDPFPEMSDFVQATAAAFGFSLVTFDFGTFKQGLQHIYDHYHVTGVFMGTRKSDPDGKYLSFVTPCSAGWPPLHRICPILTWNYQEIWAYILDQKLPYCSLYDQGFTSIGNQRNTQPNPLLREHRDGHDPHEGNEGHSAVVVGVSDHPTSTTTTTTTMTTSCVAYYRPASELSDLGDGICERLGRLRIPSKPATTNTKPGALARKPDTKEAISATTLPSGSSSCSDSTVEVEEKDPLRNVGSCDAISPLSQPSGLGLSSACSSASSSSLSSPSRSTSTSTSTTSSLREVPVRSATLSPLISVSVACMEENGGGRGGRGTFSPSSDSDDGRTSPICPP